MRANKSLIRYGIVVAISLGIIFFVGKAPAANGGTKFTITPDGVNHFRKGMDVAGGVRLTYKIDLNKYSEIYTNYQEFTQITAGVKDIILQNIDARISSLGVSDYSSYIQSLTDGEYVVVEIGGVSDLDEAKEIIGKTVELEFKTEYLGDGSDVADERRAIAEQFLVQSAATPELMGQVAANRGSDNIYYQVYTNQPVEQLPLIYQQNADLLSGPAGRVYPTLVEGTYLELPIVEGMDAADAKVDGWVISRLVATTTTTGALDASGVATTTTLYTVEDIFVDYTPSWVTAQDPSSNEILNGAFFKYANVGQSQTGRPVAIINFDEKGKQIFCNITAQIVGKPLAIFVGGQLVTSPIINEKICGGSAQIDGQFDTAGAKILVDDLNEGALPAPLILAHEEKVNPSLGEQALEGALMAALVGLIAVFLFMTVMYGPKQGTIALLTLVAFLIVLMALIKLVGYALSLSGLAAVLLSLGMGVDANVLIYERVKEERGMKKSMTSAIEDGYARSWSAIRDGNLTTFMVAILLFFMGTNVFKGFGTMLMINIILQLVVIVPLTKHLLLGFYSKSK